MESLAAENMWKITRCLGYVVGAIDGMNGLCVPSGVTKGQLADVVAFHLRDNPAERHLPAALLVRKAINEKFPCN